uniref:N-acetyltransferase 16, like n=1 Tax=Lepisosteus oculatus TaxID=7918 RepID=W5N9L8_LEPOC|nr:PREDICTED: probable N-acetyltransferase 16 [Lepisosteus oculatus]
MAAAATLGASEGLDFSLAGPEDYDDVMSMSEGIYQGSDYLPARYHAWLKEPNRLIFLARRQGKLIALESTFVVDDGKTVLVEGLRMAQSERGRGVAGVVQRFIDQYVRRHFPQVRVKRLTRGDDPGPEQLAKYRLLSQQAVLSLKGAAGCFEGLVADLQDKLTAGEGGPVPQPVALEGRNELGAVLLSPHASQNLLRGGLIIQDWQPLEPLPSNLDVLAGRSLTCLVDRKVCPTGLSICTAPYPIPYGGGSLRLNIDLYGTDLQVAQRLLTSQLERVRGALRGLVILNIYMHPTLWEPMERFCQNSAGVGRFRPLWKQVALERDL